MATMAKVQAPESPLASILSAVPNLANLFLDKNTNTTTTGNVGGSTQSQQTILSPEAINALVKSIMEGSSGLASVASGQKGAGLYNSSTNQLLTNDLISRTSGEVAARSAPTVTTNSGSKNTNVVQQQAKAQVDPLMSALGIGGSILGKKLLKNILGGTASSAASNVAASNVADVPSIVSQELPSLGGNVSNGLGGINFTGDAVSAVSGGGANILSDALGFSNVLTGTSSALSGGADLLSSFLGGDLLSNAVGLADVGSSIASGADLATSIFGDLGSSFGGIDFLGGSAASAGLGSVGAVLGPVGLALDFTSLLGGPSIGDVAGSIFEAISGITDGISVICTELYRQGLLSTDIYLLDSKYGKYYVHPTVLAGYHYWGIPLAKAMSKSQLVTKLVYPLAVAWAKEIAHKMLPTQYKPNLLGKLLFYVGIPVCFTLGKGLQYGKRVRYN